MEKIKMAFGDSPYVQILDQVYLNYDIAIQDGDLRIFPEKLKSEGVNIPEPYKSLLEKASYHEELEFSFQRVNISNLIKALTELKLRCIDASKKESVFAWETNACVYYTIGETGDAIKGRRIRLEYFIGGEKESICERLNKEFSTIITRLLGPPISDSNTLKKKLRNIEFDVALSFAGEQRDYVEKVAKILESKGIKVFYDQFHQSHLWGKDLSEYLQEVYYSKSKWCIMFLSKEYVSKAWPTHERQSALARQVELGGGYILPVRFDDTKVPGLNPSIAYEDARKQSPEEIAELFLEKFETES